MKDPKAGLPTGPSQACLALALGLFLWSSALAPPMARVARPESDLYQVTVFGAGAAVGAGIAIRGVRFGQPRWAGWMALAVNAGLVLMVLNQLVSRLITES